MAGRTDNQEGYRFGFNGKENDGETSTQDYGFRIYNPALGKFLSVDPLTYEYPFYTPYQFAGNTPIRATDLDGLEANFEAVKVNKLEYTESGYSEANVNKFVINVLVSTWNGGVDMAEWGINSNVIYNLATNGSGFKHNLDIEKKIVNGGYNWILNTSWAQKKKDVIALLSDPHTYEDLFSAFIGGKLTPKIFKVVSTGLPATKAVAKAYNFYRKAGHTVESAMQHLDGIDFTKPVETVILKKGTKVMQWVKDGKVGKYFTEQTNGFQKNLGISDYKDRVLKTFEITEDVEVLKSTAGDYKGAKGGGTQYFGGDIKVKEVPYNR